MPGGLHTTGQAGTPHVPATSKQYGLIIVMGGSVFNTEISSDGTQTANVLTMLVTILDTGAKGAIPTSFPSYSCFLSLLRSFNVYFIRSETL
jgi:hypothetical protein